MIEQDGTIVVHAMDKNVRSEKITLDESPDSLETGNSMLHERYAAWCFMI